MSYVDDAELEEIRRRKLLEYQRRMEEMARREEQRRVEEMRRQEILRKILTPEARQRLANLRMVRPELVENLEVQLINLAMSGRISLPIDDAMLKRVLAELSERSRREIRIRYLRT